MTDLMQRRLEAIDTYVQERGFRSYDPYDGLLSPLAKAVVGRSTLRARVWQQAVRRFPVNIRPLLGISKLVHTKTISDFASAYALLAGCDDDTKHKAKARHALRQLWEIALPGAHSRGWGLRFPFATRFIRANYDTPNVFQTINAVHAFLDGYEALGDEDLREKATQGLTFLIEDIGYVDHGSHMIWNYWPGLRTPIYNVNGLMAGLLARMAGMTGDAEPAAMARKLIVFLCQGQNDDGSWYYSADHRGTWVDGFHTGYILEGLVRSVQAGIADGMDCLKRGTIFYRERCFTSRGLPKYYDRAVRPIDAQNAAQAIQTLVFLKELSLSTEAEISRTVLAVDTVLWNEKGFYNHRKGRFLTSRIPMHRWSTGPMFLALARTFTVLRESDS